MLNFTLGIVLEGSALSTFTSFMPGSLSLKKNKSFVPPPATSSTSCQLVSRMWPSSPVSTSNARYVPGSRPVRRISPLASVSFLPIEVPSLKISKVTPAIGLWLLRSYFTIRRPTLARFLNTSGPAGMGLPLPSSSSLICWTSVVGS